MSDCIEDMEAFTRLTDNIFHVILTSTEDNLKEAREILQKIERRQVYKFVGQAIQPDKTKNFQQVNIKPSDNALYTQIDLTTQFVKCIKLSLVKTWTNVTVTVTVL